MLHTSGACNVNGSCLAGAVASSRYNSGGKPPHSIKRIIRSFLKIALMFAVLFFPCCGYRVRSSVGRLPGGAESIGIPTFRNLTGEANIEQILTRALLREFSSRTRGRVDSSSAGVDFVLLGEVRSVNTVPVTFGAQNSGELTFSSAFQVTVRIGVKLVRQRDSAVIWENDDYVYRERYPLNSDARDFFAEDNPAFERLARDFAAALASMVFSF